MNMKINPEDIEKLAKLLHEEDLNEIELTDGDKSIRVSRGGGSVIATAPAPAAPVSMPSDPTLPQPASISADTTAHSHPGAVTSPMVGTAYLQSEPGTPAFVSKGDTVNPGDTLVIIEAMKVMNPIKAEKGGVVTQILIDDGQPIEFGDVLMVIE